MGNEYGLCTKLVLPTSQRINIVNVYVPPTSSLTRRDITEAQATAQVEIALEQMQPQHITIICGDFNARICARAPLLNNDHPPRIVTDTHICARATWFI